jgi:hypothetical protein
MTEYLGVSAARFDRRLAISSPGGNIWGHNHSAAELDQTDEDILNEVSDETLEAAAGAYIGGQFMMTVGPTIMMGGCC